MAFIGTNTKSHFVQYLFPCRVNKILEYPKNSFEARAVLPILLTPSSSFKSCLNSPSSVGMSEVTCFVIGLIKLAIVS